ncbi:hypothetical protein LJC06_03105 [Bacteroidales bacterium OttesenSCG-928-I14]|nr:hypothetical protein [Bacteroidales bacterium OttesenSCG-928-I14]
MKKYLLLLIVPLLWTCEKDEKENYIDNIEKYIVGEWITETTISKGPNSISSYYSRVNFDKDYTLVRISYFECIEGDCVEDFLGTYPREVVYTEKYYVNQEKKYFRLYSEGETPDESSATYLRILHLDEEKMIFSAYLDEDFEKLHSNPVTFTRIK